MSSNKQIELRKQALEAKITNKSLPGKFKDFVDYMRLDNQTEFFISSKVGKKGLTNQKVYRLSIVYPDEFLICYILDDYILNKLAEKYSGKIVELGKDCLPNLNPALWEIEKWDIDFIVEDKWITNVSEKTGKSYHIFKLSTVLNDIKFEIDMFDSYVYETINGKKVQKPKYYDALEVGQTVNFVKDSQVEFDTNSDDENAEIESELKKRKEKEKKDAEIKQAKIEKAKK